MKEGRKKQAVSNKQQGKATHHTQSSHCIHDSMYNEGRKKQAVTNKQQGKATQHTQGSHCIHDTMYKKGDSRERGECAEGGAN